jgi:hypothetical protein
LKSPSTDVLDVFYLIDSLFAGGPGGDRTGSSAREPPTAPVRPRSGQEL